MENNEFNFRNIEFKDNVQWVVGYTVLELRRQISRLKVEILELDLFLGGSLIFG